MSEAVMWNQLASTYEEEVFDVYKNDKHKKVMHYIQKHADLKKTAIDYGCGVGKALPLLSPVFKEVMAVDISQNCLDKAKAKYAPENIKFKQADLGKSKIDLPMADFIFCCNVAIAPNINKNYRILKNALSFLKRKGTAVFVLPSLESASHSKQQLVQWYLKEGLKISDIPKQDLARIHNINSEQPLKGFIKLSDTLNKHYLFNELYALFNSENMVVESIDRVEYSWDTEFVAPPKWMTDPYPWDWLIEVRRKS